MDRVVAVGQGPVYVHQLEADDPEPALLEPAENATRQQALDGVGLDQDDRAFVHGASGGAS